MLKIIRNHLESIKAEAAAGTPVDPDLIKLLEEEVARLESWID